MKPFHKKAQKPLALALSLAFSAMMSAHANVNIFDYVYKTPKHQYDNVAIFGDSLSDPGSDSGGRFVAGGLGYPGYFDVLSRQISGKPSISVSKGGTNYAIASSGSDGVYLQVQAYLANNGGKAEDKNIYVLWAGGSDVNTQVIRNFYKLPFYNFQQPEFTLPGSGYNPSQYIHDSAKLLIEAGAPFVIVPNVPSAAYVPIVSTFALDVALVLVTSAVALLPPLPIQIDTRDFNLSVREAVGTVLDPIFGAFPPARQGFDALAERSIDFLQVQFFFLPRPLVAELYRTLVNIQNDATRQFNYSTVEALKPLDGHILYADIAALLLEGINHANEWGIDRVSSQACKVAYTAAECSSEKGNFKSHESYFFGDWFHPSWHTHVAIAQYILSILNAPDQAASIVRQVMNLNYGSQETLQTHLAGARLSTAAQGDFSVYASYSGLFDRPKAYVGGEKHSYTNILNIGFDYFYQPNWVAGALLSLSYGKQKPFENFNFKQTSQNILLYTQWQSEDQKYWVNANLNYAHLKAKNIDRTVRILKANFLESGNSTTANMVGFTAKLGWNILAGKNDNKLQTGPFGGLSFNRYKLKGYTEKSGQFTAMRFDNATYNQNYATLGWYVNAANWSAIADKPLTVSAAISYNQLLKQKDFRIPARLNTSPLTFKKDIELGENKRWLDASANLNFEVARETKLNFGLGARYDKQKNKNFYLSLGVAKNFK